MTASILSLTSSLSSLSFSSNVAQKPTTVSFPRSRSASVANICGTPSRMPWLVVSATVASPEVETVNLKKYVKSRLPGGFAAQTIIGTGRRKCAIARVVLQEGTGKVVINYRDAKVVFHFLISEFFFLIRILDLFYVQCCFYICL